MRMRIVLKSRASVLPIKGLLVTIAALIVASNSHTIAIVVRKEAMLPIALFSPVAVLVTAFQLIPNHSALLRRSLHSRRSRLSARFLIQNSLPNPEDPSPPQQPNENKNDFEVDDMNYQHHHHDRRRRQLEFDALEPIPMSPTRRERIELQESIRAQFVTGDALWEMRALMDDITATLSSSDSSSSSSSSKISTRQRQLTLRSLEEKDPERVYRRELFHLEQAARDGRLAKSQQHRNKAMAARSCLPHFQLEGLWVGKYGSNGYQVINITYSGDTLIATKVTGDKNVPRGEITFQANLSPWGGNPINFAHAAKRRLPFLPPIQLTEKAAKKWSTKKLARYSGLGQVAEEGYHNHQWMDGQLIIIGSEYFSFAWIPIENQIFFGRPSPELALKLLRESDQQLALQQQQQLLSLSTTTTTTTPSASATVVSESIAEPPSMEADVAVQRHFASRMLEATMDMEDEILSSGDTLGCIWHGESTDECCFE